MNNVENKVRYAAFLSYSTFDDEHNNRIISGLSTLISREVKAQTSQEFPIFQDRKDIGWGENWKKRIEETLDEATYLIAFITPNFFASSYCRDELARFAEREKGLGRDDLILPIYWMNVRELEGRIDSPDKCIQLFRERQRLDWRDLRFEDLSSPRFRRAVAELAASISESMSSTGIEERSDSQAIQPIHLTDPRRLPSLLDMIPVPSGSFVMGSDAPEARQRENPAHTVRLAKSFAISRHPITVLQFRAFCDSTGYVTQMERHESPRNTWKNPGLTQADDHPVIYVSWFDAMEFCRWLSTTEGRLYRLPREEEWEYACRANTETSWSCGDHASDLPNYAWYKTNCSGTKAVGSKSPNPFGLFDMHGNVWEWCSDGYNQYTADGSLTTPINNRYRVAKGGSWVDSARHLRSSFRIRVKPFQACKNLGFRVVREDT